jgi:hypothetical protein
MAIPGPGTPIDLTDLATEFGDSAPHSVSEFYRGGGKVPDSAGNSAIPTSGSIALGNFYGSANIVALALTITSNTNNYDLYSVVSSNPSYSAGSTAVTLTVNPGVTVGSTSTGTYALSVPNSFNPADTVTIVNNGTIVGRGGNGGTGGFGNGQPGGTGGNAVYVNRPVTFDNNATLAGGGGGGASSSKTDSAQGFYPKSGSPSGTVFLRGAGGGGGAGVTGGSGGLGGPSNPGGFAISGNGATGSATTGGAGGNRAHNPIDGKYSGKGGNGGARGANGSPPEYGSHNSAVHAGTGGTRGRYMTGNPYVTWQSTGTRLGGVS